MRNVEGGSVQVRLIRSTKNIPTLSLVASIAPEQELNTQTSSSRVLRIRAARSWVNCSRVPPRPALCVASAPLRTERGPVPIGVGGSVSPTPAFSQEWASVGPCHVSTYHRRLPSNEW